VIVPIEKEDIFHRILAQNKGRFLFIAQQYASADEVMDLYQEIQHQLWKSLDRFNGRSATETWAFGLALHTASTYRRNNDRRARALRAYGQDLQTEQMGGRDEEKMLEEFEQSLPDIDRNLFALHLTNLSNQKIAEFAEISELNLRVRISRLKNRFKQRYL
jgi:RNA polymerase sigma-70 factor, ECF subfamily